MCVYVRERAHGASECADLAPAGKHFVADATASLLLRCIILLLQLEHTATTATTARLRCCVPIKPSSSSS